MFFKKPAASPAPVAIENSPASNADPAQFNVLVADTRSGPMIVNRNDIYIGQSFIQYGEYSNAEIALFEQWVRAGDVVVEVGANIGSFTVEFSRLVGTAGAVIAFEPQRLVFQLLCGNLALRSCANVNAQQMALGAERGAARIPYANPLALDNFGGVAVEHGDARADRVETVPQDTLDNWQLASCRFIKIDVEGMEIDVLRGAQQTLARCRPILYVENDRDEHHDELVALIDDAGYDLYWHLPQLYRLDSYRGDTSKEDLRTVSINVLCLPKELIAPRDEAWALKRSVRRSDGLGAVANLLQRSRGAV